MRFQNNYFALTSGLIVSIVLAGCNGIPKPKTGVEDAIELCGNIGKLQAANISYLQEIKSLVVTKREQVNVKYADLTPELRVSAMRSTVHCINLQTNRITSEQYGQLMAAESGLASSAESNLSKEQLEDLISKGYQTVASILTRAGVSDIPTRTKDVATCKTEIGEEYPQGGAMERNSEPKLDAINSAINGIGSKIDELPSKVLNEVKTYFGKHATSPPKALATVFFSSGDVLLNDAATSKLRKLARELPLESHFIIVGSADPLGLPLKNMELSRQRAQSVAVWLLANTKIEPWRIHVSAAGSSSMSGELASSRAAIVYQRIN